MNNNFSNVFLTCLFLLGNSVITFFSGSIFSLVLFLLFCAFAVFVLNKTLCLTGFSVKIFKSDSGYAPFKAILFGVLFAFCLFAFTATVNDYSFVLENNTVFRIVFCVLSLCLALLNRNVIKMFAKVSFFIVVFSFLIMFLSSSRYFELSFLKNSLRVSQSLKPAFVSFLQSFGTLFICFLFLGEQSKKSAKTISSYTLTFGAYFYLICFFNSLLVIGPKVSQMVFSPYSFSGAGIFSGGEFSRVDFVVYYVFFICAVIKCSVILWVVLNSAKQIHPVLKRVTALVFLIMGTFDFSFFNNNIVLLTLEVLAPLLFFIFLMKLNSRQQARHS